MHNISEEFQSDSSSGTFGHSHSVYGKVPELYGYNVIELYVFQNELLTLVHKPTISSRQ